MAQSEKNVLKITISRINFTTYKKYNILRDISLMGEFILKDLEIKKQSGSKFNIVKISKKIKG